MTPQTGPATIAEALAEAAARLAPLHESARLDAEVLLAHCLGRDRSHLYAWPERALEPAVHAAFLELVAGRAAGRPVAYLIGRREFWSLALAVGPETLIPRPETETLVEAVLARVPAAAAWRLADLGTGSGAVALALAAERPACRVVATDRSAAALGQARANAAELGIGNVEFREGDWFGPLGAERFHVIASNPPYVAEADPHLEQGDVRFEPRNALAAGPEGLDDLRRLAAGAPGHLEPGGWLVVEHGWDQGPAVRDLMAGAGARDVATTRDPAGHERVTAGRW